MLSQRSASILGPEDPPPAEFGHHVIDKELQTLRKDVEVQIEAVAEGEEGRDWTTGTGADAGR